MTFSSTSSSKGHANQKYQPSSSGKQWSDDDQFTKAKLAGLGVKYKRSLVNVHLEYLVKAMLMIKRTKI